jgi:hypothetical protein
MEIPASPFRDDDGSADPRLMTAMAAWGRGEVSMAELALMLRASRLLIPVVAVLDSTEDVPASPTTGRADDVPASPALVEKDSHMAMPLMVRPDGRRGLLAFTSVESLRHWQPEARAIPVWGADAAQAAIDEPADALVVDVVGPTRVAVAGEALTLMANGEGQPAAGSRP